jgi:putative ABC transport system substrate-binding protein
VRDGLVTSLNRPGGNVTGVVFIIGELGTKRLELLRRLVPKAAVIAMLVHPNTAESEAERGEIQAAARSIGQSLIAFDVQSARDIDAAFTKLSSQRIDSLMIGTGAFMFNSREQIVTLARRYAIREMYPFREAVAAGGLVSYGSSLPDGFRQAGIYTGRILKGEKPADLPVIRSTKFDLVINLKTAKSLGIKIPPILLAIADEVIE